MWSLCRKCLLSQLSGGVFEGLSSTSLCCLIIFASLFILSPSLIATAIGCFLSYFSIVIKCHDQCSLLEEAFNWAYGSRALEPMMWRESTTARSNRAPSQTSRRRQREHTRNGWRLWNLRPAPVTHLLLQRHTTSPSQTTINWETKRLNLYEPIVAIIIVFFKKT